MTLKDIADVFEIRASFGILGLQSAAERITDGELDDLERQLYLMTDSTRTEDPVKWVETDTALHAIIYKASRNERLMQILSHLQEPIQRLRTASLFPAGSRSRWRSISGWWKRSMSAMPTLGSSLAKTHIENAEQSMMNALKTFRILPDRIVPPNRKIKPTKRKK